MNKEQKKQIKKLKRQKKYDDIYYLYGPEEYRRNTPFIVQRRENKRLKMEGRYIDLYNKLGGGILYKLELIEMKGKDAQNETGSKFQYFKGQVSYTLRVIRNFLLFLGTAGFIGVSSITPSLALSNGINYKQEIEEYDKKIKEYADEIKKMNLSDLEIFMKLMEDTWKNIEGYGMPKKDLTGYWRLDFLEDNQAGVCRNLADDLTSKLNEINPKYNARNFIAYLDSDVPINIANIETRDAKEKVNVNSENIANNEEQGSKFKEKLNGNHMVTAVDVKEGTLILDPTNIGIGYFKDGKIYMLWNEKGSGMEYPIIGNYLLEGLQGVIDVPKEIAISFLQHTKSQDVIEEKYGVDAQNKALNKIRSMKSFSEKIKVPAEKLRQGKKNNLKENNNIQENDKEETR